MKVCILLLLLSVISGLNTGMIYDKGYKVNKEKRSSSTLMVTLYDLSLTKTCARTDGL